MSKVLPVTRGDPGFQAGSLQPRARPTPRTVVSGVLRGQLQTEQGSTSRGQGCPDSLGPCQTLAPAPVLWGTQGKAGGGRTRHGRGAAGRAAKEPQEKGERRGRPGGRRGVRRQRDPTPGSLPAASGALPPRPAPPRRGRATSSSDVSRRRHIGKAPPPPPLPPPPPPPPPRSSGSPWAATAGRKKPLARPDARPARFAPARLPMTAPGPATDGRSPSARV